MVEAKSTVVGVRIKAAGIEALDSWRGSLSRSEFIKQLLRDEAARRAKQ